MLNSALVGLPIEILVHIFGQLEDICSVNAVRKTSKHLRGVLSCNETTVAGAMSRSSKFFIPASRSTSSITTSDLPSPDAYYSVTHLYPAKSYSPTGGNCFAWLRILEKRMSRVTALSTLDPPPDHYFRDVSSSGRWHPDTTHYLWRFLEIPNRSQLETFLGALDTRMIIRMDDVLDTAISCALSASTYRSLAAAGEEGVQAPSFGQVMRDMRRRNFQRSTRNPELRGVLIRSKNMSRGDLLDLAEKFICEDPSFIGVFPTTDAAVLPDENNTICERDRMLEDMKARRRRESCPILLRMIFREMHGHRMERL